MRKKEVLLDWSLCIGVDLELSLKNPSERKLERMLRRAGILRANVL